MATLGTVERSVTLPLDELERAPATALVDCCGATHRGLVRERNEDQFALERLERGALLAVADGMGGHGGGNIASAVVLQSMRAFVHEWVDPLASDVEPHDMQLSRALIRGVHEAQNHLREVSELAHMAETKPGTTLTLAYIASSFVHIIHVGDSRCYLLRDGALRQLTRDHNLAERMSDGDGDAEITPSPLRNVLYNCVGGGSPELQPDSLCLQLAVGDQLLLCSDGISGAVARRDIEQIVLAERTSRAACARLIDAANRAGGRDNSTVVIARFAGAS